IRKEREIDPAVETLKACVTDAEGDPKLHPVARKRLNDMLAFVETLDRWYMQMLTVPKPKLAALIRLSTRIVSLLPVSKRKWSPGRRVCARAQSPRKSSEARNRKRGLSQALNQGSN